MHVVYVSYEIWYSLVMKESQKILSSSVVYCPERDWFVQVVFIVGVCSSVTIVDRVPFRNIPQLRVITVSDLPVIVVDRVHHVRACCCNTSYNTRPRLFLFLHVRSDNAAAGRPGCDYRSASSSEAVSRRRNHTPIPIQSPIHPHRRDDHRVGSNTSGPTYARQTGHHRVVVVLDASK